MEAASKAKADAEAAHKTALDGISDKYNADSKALKDKLAADSKTLSNEKAASDAKFAAEFKYNAAKAAAAKAAGHCGHYCQTEYIKLKLLNNNANAYVNAKRLKWQRQAGSFCYWAEYVHFETIGAIQREMEDLTAKQEEWEFEHGEKLKRAQD